MLYSSETNRTGNLFDDDNYYFITTAESDFNPLL